MRLVPDKRRLCCIGKVNIHFFTKDINYCINKLYLVVLKNKNNTKELFYAFEIHSRFNKFIFLLISFEKLFSYFLKKGINPAFKKVLKEIVNFENFEFLTQKVFGV